jgi:hypothetical protein
VTVVSLTRPGPGPNTPEEVSPKLAVMTEITSEGASGIVVLSEVLLVAEAVEEEEVVDVVLCVDDEAEDNTSENGLMMLPDAEDEEVELGLPGRSPPLNGVSVSTPVTVELGELVDSARAGTDVEVVKVDDVAAAVLATAEVPLENVDPVEVTVVVVKPVVPRLPPGAEDMRVSRHLNIEMPKTYFLLILEPHSHFGDLRQGPRLVMRLLQESLKQPNPLLP